MITASGYSKDPSIMPEGIVVTLPVQFFENRRTNIYAFKIMFERFMKKDDALWHFRLTNLPTMDIAWVYLDFDNHIQYRCNFVQYERKVAKSFKDAPDGKLRHFPKSNWVIFTGPVIATPPWHYWYENKAPGFQGFRYCTQLF